MGTLGCNGGNRNNGVRFVRLALLNLAPLKSEVSWVRVSVVDGWRGSRSGDDVMARSARWRSSAAARIMASRDAVDILNAWGSHLTVSAMRVAFVDGVHTVWHLHCSMAGPT